MSEVVFLRKIIDQLSSGLYLNRSTSCNLARALGSGSVSPVLSSCILTLMNTRPFSSDEVLGFRDGILQSSLCLDLSDFDPLDICGTGGDGRNSFNISTASALLVASIGIPVSKHGNYAVSSSCGSSNILESLGYVPKNDQDRIKSELDKTNFTFLHAPLFHRAMKEIAPVRKELGVKTIFNCLGPLLNPALVRYQLAGVYGISVFNLYRDVLGVINDERGGGFFVGFFTDIADEISLTAPAKIAFSGKEIFLRPGSGIRFEEVDFPLVRDSDIRAPGSISDSCDLMKKFLSGDAPGPLEDVIVTNAAFAVYARDMRQSFEGIVEMLRASLRDGRAFKNTRTLIDMQ
ncbi:MAG TPA: anthranilate phosphoribosyltransferase [Oligoflexia bacterium]|nr:anthranilate phosphoribosyltransferase [Oligoflexia bacterium]